MRIHNFFYDDETRRLTIEFSTKKDSDEFYRLLELDYSEIEFYSPDIIEEEYLYDIDETFVIDLIEEYLKENDLPDELFL
jgi:hypothetical protein